MSNVVWLSAYHHDGEISLVEQQQAFTSLRLSHTRVRKQQPIHVAWIGKRSKSATLRHLFLAAKENVPFDPHGQLRLWSHPYTREDDHPVVIIDCEIHCSRESQSVIVQSPGPEVTHQLRHGDGRSQPRIQKDVGIELYARVIAPFTSVMVLFSGDLGGLKGTAEMLAKQVVCRLEYDVPQQARMRVLVVLPIRCGPSATEALLRSVIREMREIRYYETEDAAWQELRLFASAIEVFSFNTPDSPEKRALALHSTISKGFTVVQEQLHECRKIFSLEHTRVLLGIALDRFAKHSGDRFNFIKATRSGLGPTTDFQDHVDEIIAKIPIQSLQFRVGIPILASALVMDSLPPGMHVFRPSQVFDDLYGISCLQAICRSTIHRSVQQSFMINLRKSFIAKYAEIDIDLSAAESHLKRMSALQPHIGRIKSNKTCLCCIMRTPEKVLSCGHALCDTCILNFGKKSISEKYSYTLPSCVICGKANKYEQFKFVPPTAGTRILSLDGGGVKGVIPLTFLKQIETLVVPLGCPLRDLFDLVCGTSSGGLIILGIFIMKWDVKYCLQRFEQLADNIFQRRSNGPSMFVRIQELIMSYIADCKYESSGIENALRDAFGSNLRMFNPLCNDTKVAVTSTTAKDSLPCLFSNYNGCQRSAQSGYSIVRAQNPEHDITVSEAARCTSAAPWFFRPKVLRHLGTFQDGGLRHNNPLGIALWENRSLWPAKGEPDFAISLGTGATKSVVPSFISGSLSPVKERFLPRLIKTFLASIDGETAWNELANTLSKDSRTKFHRLNIVLEDRHLGIDEVSNMSKLRSLAQDHIDSASRFTTVRDSIYASMFYFELDSLPDYTSSGIMCSGSIFCRLNLSQRGREELYLQLHNSSAFFLVNGRPYRCLDAIPRCLPPFKKSVEFLVQKPSDMIAIFIRNITSASRLISGQPKSLEEMIKVQRLDAPFGRPDHVQSEKALPIIPQKRKVQSLASHWTLRRKKARIG